MRHKHWLMGAACVVLLAGSTLAQDQPRRPQGGFGFGRGGAGGELQILNMAEVQKELGVTDDQKTKITEALAGVQQAGGGFNFRELQNLSQEERQKKMEELRAKMEGATKKATEAINGVLDAKQKERFAQLRLQRQGIASLSTPAVAEKLGLTQEQKDKIAKLGEDRRAAFGAGGGFNPNATDEERRAAREKAQKATQKYETDMAAVLTADQKASWEKMLGAKFDFPQQRGGFGAGRPGAAGGPGAGGGERRRPPPTTDKTDR
ncbi:MAG: hypothetical protein HYS13_22555 [Planctomycetia bacterium]|nr:hypothetical protein [Planctomycetia bacterium]